MINIIGQAPAPGSKDNPPESNIQLSISGGTNGVKLSSVIVKINGEVALLNGSFTRNFSESSMEFVNSDLTLQITRSSNFKLDDIVTVDVTAANLRNKRFSQKYVFYVEKSHPVLIETNLNSKITEHSVLYLEFADSNYTIDPDTLNIFINEEVVVSNGRLATFFNKGDSSIEFDEHLAVRIDHPEFFRNGIYNLKYSLSNSLGNKLSDKIKFEIDVKKIIYPDAFPVSGFVGPTKGVAFARNMGVGDTMEVELPEVSARSNKSEVFYLIYYKAGTELFFDQKPKVITKNRITTINGLTPNQQLYWGARCLEAYNGVFDLRGMDTIDDGYIVPDSTELFSTFDSESLLLYVDSTDGYPDKGLLIIENKEVVRYSIVNREENYFVIEQRGLNNTVPSLFYIGDSVELFLKCQDNNQNIIMGTPTFEDGYLDDGYGSGREYDGVGFIVNDYEDQNRKFFQGFDFCGYHQALPDRVLQGIDDCGSYLGGEFNGSRGFNIYDRMLNREEVILDQVGEPVILLKRKWSGITCDCMTSRRGHPKARSCNRCYGTGYVGGYDQFINRRRNDKMMMISFPDTVEDLKLDPKSNLEQVYEASCWTLPIPKIADRDIIVRFDFSGDQEYFYEVLNVSSEKLLYKHYGRQKVSVKRLDKTNLVYHFNYIINS
jgi:hypothetical protein